MARELTEEHKAAMQVGRTKKAEADRKAGMERVRAYMKYSEDDAALWSKFYDGFITREERIEQQPIWEGPLPEDRYWPMVREEDARA